MMRRLLTSIALAAVLPAMPALAAPAQHGKMDHKAHEKMMLAEALANPRRDADKPRDQYRHPVQTLDFFKVTPHMTVVDYMPSGGWWTRVLVPYLNEHGRYIALNPDVRTAPERMRQSFGAIGATFPAQAAEWTGVPAERIAAYNTDVFPAELNGTVDRVLIFREIHNMWRFGWLRGELLAMRTMLKPDGMLGIEQHRARPNAPAAYTDGSKGYLREQDVIALIEAHGFQFVGKSEVNANPRDTADHADGVWTLPPAYRLGDKDRAKYAAIGESDRMTLLFRKRP